MNIASKTEPVGDKSASDAYFDLEEPIRDVAYMAGIVDMLATDLLGVQTTPPTDESVTINLTRYQYDRFVFAISKASQIAAELNRTYLGR